MQEDVGIASIGLRVTDIPLISDQFANTDAGYLPNLFTIDTADSAVGMYVVFVSLRYYSVLFQMVMTIIASQFKFRSHTM